jgi:hypothetical protein
LPTRDKIVADRPSAINGGVTASPINCMARPGEAASFRGPGSEIAWGIAALGILDMDDLLAPPNATQQTRLPPRARPDDAIDRLAAKGAPTI